MGIAAVITAILGFIGARLIWRQRRKHIYEEVEEENLHIKEQLNVAFDDVMALAKANDPAFLVRFQEVYPIFYSKLIDLHDGLTATDIKLCAMTYLNISTADIAKYTFVEIRTVQTRRSRLRKKINLAPDVDLFLYLQGLEHE